MPWPLTLLACVLGGATVLLLVARFLALQAVRTAVEREKADRVFEAAKKDEEARAAKAVKAVADDKAARAAKIDGMGAKELEREINK